MKLHEINNYQARIEPKSMYERPFIPNGIVTRTLNYLQRKRTNVAETFRDTTNRISRRRFCAPQFLPSLLALQSPRKNSGGNRKKASQCP